MAIPKTELLRRASSWMTISASLYACHVAMTFFWARERFGTDPGFITSNVVSAAFVAGMFVLARSFRAGRNLQSGRVVAGFFCLGGVAGSVVAITVIPSDALSYGLLAIYLLAVAAAFARTTWFLTAAIQSVARPSHPRE